MSLNKHYKKGFIAQSTVNNKINNSDVFNWHLHSCIWYSRYFPLFCLTPVIWILCERIWWIQIIFAVHRKQSYCFDQNLDAHAYLCVCLLECGQIDVCGSLKSSVTIKEYYFAVVRSHCSWLRFEYLRARLQSSGITATVQPPETNGKLIKFSCCFRPLSLPYLWK